MRFTEQLRMIQRLHQKIRLKATGRPASLAGELNISAATLYRYLDTMRDLGAEIAYCPYRQSYYYEVDFKFEL
ncbi:MAG TPA: hypothetical protein PKA00_17560 [Saprospiraceae bacterium]|nr:hypothetical protein [Saprospiraceae bacterium]HMQ84729.1 hypothetical protein [Saprospiraceae bacterium]